MKLDWKRIGVMHTAKGSHGFTFLVKPVRHTGGTVPPFAVTKRQAAIRHGRTVKHEEVWTCAEGMALAQDWEDGNG